MLIKVNYQDKIKSEYKCDKCGTSIDNSNLCRVIFLKRTYHLCSRCSIILKRWIKNVK